VVLSVARVYLNGEYLPLEEARVPVLDRGFLFGDGVYEVIPVYGGRPFRLAEHMDRLDRSLAAIRLENPLSRSAWGEVFTRVIPLPAGDAGGGRQAQPPVSGRCPAHRARDGLGGEAAQPRDGA
jgi:hypothetical protein